MAKKTLLTLLLTSLFLNGCFDDKKQPTNEIVTHTLSNATYIFTKSTNALILQKAPKRIVLFDLFATWCPPCIDEINVLNRLAKKYQKDILIIGVDVEANIDKQKLIDFAKKHTLNYPLLDANASKKIIPKILHDTKVGDHFGIPLLVLYRDGKLFNFYQGATEEEFIESDIKRALGE